MNKRAIKERPIEKPLPIMNRRTDERTEYKKRSFKEKQAVKSMALEFMQKSSAQQIFERLQETIPFQVSDLLK